MSEKAKQHKWKRKTAGFKCVRCGSGVYACELCGERDGACVDCAGDNPVLVAVCPGRREPAPARPDPAASRGTPVSPLNEPFTAPMVFDRNVVATHRVQPAPATGFLTDQEREAVEVAIEVLDDQPSTAASETDDIVRRHTLDMLLKRDRGECPIGNTAHETGGPCFACPPKSEPAPAASSEFELSAFGKALVAGGTFEDALAAEGVRLDLAPAGCPLRELLRESTGRLDCDGGPVESGRCRCLAHRIEEALLQPCAAPGDCKHREVARMKEQGR